MDAGLAEKDTDTPDMKEVKEEMKNLVSEDPDEAFEILTSTSSMRFSEMQEDERNDSQNDRTSDDEDDTDNEKTRTGKNDSDSSDETPDSNDQDTESKTRKYFGKLKTKLKKAAKWLNENKDKTLDDVLVQKWKDNCSEEKLKSSMAKCKKKGQKKKSKKSSGSKCAKLQSHKEWDLLILRDY